MKFRVIIPLWIILLVCFYSPGFTERLDPDTDWDEPDDGFFEFLNSDRSVFDLGLPESVPTCDTGTEYQCQKSLECIDKFKYCDHVPDCQDSSDEITCGLLDFTSRK